MNEKVIVHLTVSLGTGLGTFLKNIINQQIKDGNKVVLCTYGIRKDKIEEIKSEIPSTVEIINMKPNIMMGKLKKGYIFFGMPLKKINKIINKKYKNKLIIFHAHNPVSIGILNSMFLPTNNIICTLHGSRQLPPHVKWPEKFILRNLVQKYIPIIAVSYHTANVFNSSLNHNYVKVIHNGLNIKKIPKKKRNTKNLIGFVSHLSRPKGWELLFEAFKKLNQNNPNTYELIFVGPGDENNTKHLLEKINKNNLQDSVHYLGYIKNASKEIIPKLDTLVLPSLNEGFGLVIIEALANGVPVLVSADGGMKEIVQDQYNGLLIQELNSEEIHDKLQMLFSDKYLYKRIQKNAVLTYENNFTSDKMCQQYYLEYDKQIYNEEKNAFIG